MTEALSQLNENTGPGVMGEGTRTYSVSKNLINLYAKPDTSAEVVTQSLMNSVLTAEKEEAGFVYVAGADHYHGWADIRHLVTIPPHAVPPAESTNTSGATRASVSSLWAEVRSEPTNRAELLTKLVISTSIELIDAEAQDGFFQVKLAGGVIGWLHIEDVTVDAPTTLLGWESLNRSERKALIAILGKKVVSHAERFIGVPYLWGGCSPFGIDCSGLVQICYQLEGLSLLRDADLQFEDKRFTRIEEESSLSEALFETGDLLVFGSTNSITHIGLASDDGRFIHASGRQANFGTYYDHCSSKSWGAIYMGAVRLSTEASLSIDAS